MPEQQHRNGHLEKDFIPENPTATRMNAERGLPEWNSSFGSTSPRLTAHHGHSLKTADVPMKSTPMVIGKEVIERQEPSLTLLPIIAKAGSGGGASHSSDASSGFPGAFHRSSCASFSERLAGSTSQQQRVKENRARNRQYHSNGKQQPEASVGSDTLPENEDISDLNNRRISAMSASEILKAQEEIRNSFPEALLKGLQCRNKKQLLQNSNSRDDGMKTKQQQPPISQLSDNASVGGNTKVYCGSTEVDVPDKGGELPISLNDGVLPRNEKELEAFVQRLPKEERSKLQWALDEEEKREGEKEGSTNSEKMKEPRVDFDGKAIPRDSSTPHFLGLHHHGQDIMSAGYTVRELVHLSRSTLLSQRILALRALVGALRERRISLDRGELPLHSQLSNDVLPVLRMALDGEGRVLELGLQGLLYFTVHPSNELAWFARPGISLDGHAPILPIIRPMCTADEVNNNPNPYRIPNHVPGVQRPTHPDMLEQLRLLDFQPSHPISMGWLQHHDDEASKSEKAEEKDKGIEEEGYDDSWLNDSATPGRMFTDPIRGCIVASGALARLTAIVTSWKNNVACGNGGRSVFEASVTVSALRVLIAVCRRGLPGAARVASCMDLLRALKGQILSLRWRQHTSIGPSFSSVATISNDTWQCDDSAVNSGSDCDAIVAVWGACLVRSMAEGGREVAEHLCAQGLAIAIRSMLVAGFYWEKGQGRLLQAVRSCAYNAWGSFLCYGFDLEGLGQVMAALSESGGGGAACTSSAQHPVITKLLEDSCSWASMAKIPQNVAFSTYICLSKAVAAYRKEEERTLVPVLCHIGRGVVSWLKSIFKDEATSNHPATRPQITSALYFLSQTVLFFGSADVIAGEDHSGGGCSSLVQLLKLLLSSSSFITATEWVVKHTFSKRKEKLMASMKADACIPLSASHSSPSDWMCAVLYLLLALHSDRNTAATTTALETQAIVAWASMAKAANTIADESAAAAAFSSNNLNQWRQQYSAPRCSIVMCHFLVCRVLQCVVLPSWPAVVHGIDDALVYPCSVLSLLLEYRLEEMYSFVILALVEGICVGNEETETKEQGQKQNKRERLRPLFVRVIEEHLGGRFAVYQSQLSCMGSSPYELQLLCTTTTTTTSSSSFHCYNNLLPRDWLLLPLWDAMALSNSQERTSEAVTICLRMIKDLYDEDSESSVFFSCTAMVAVLRRLAARPVPTLLALLNIARMDNDVVLSEWCIDHYKYILCEVLRHCSRARECGWGEALAMEAASAAAVNSQVCGGTLRVKGGVDVVPDTEPGMGLSGRLKDGLGKELECIAKDICHRFMEGAIYDGFILPALLVLLRPDVPARVRVAVWSGIGRVGLLNLISAAASDHDVEQYYDCNPGSIMLDAYTEALQHPRFLDDRESLLFKVACHGLSHYFLSGVEESPALKWGQCRRLKRLPEVARHCILSLAQCMVENGHITRHMHVDTRLQSLKSIYQ